MKEIINVGNKCKSCSACWNSCPTGAITHSLSDIGFYSPFVDSKKCVSCKKCLSVCQEITPVKNNSIINTYVGTLKDNTDCKKSASGGAAYAFGKSFIDNCMGIVFGATLSDKNEIVFDYSDNVEDLSKFRGSKYSESYIKDSYCKALEFINDGRNVLFIGLPCQVAGLLDFIPKENHSLLTTVDLICHGIPSQLYLKEHIEKRYGKNASISAFRTSNGDFKISIKKKNKIKVFPFSTDLYMYGFINGLCYRKSCYLCEYANTNRVSDITIGDFWGIGKIKPYKSSNGKISESIIITNTKKGEELLLNSANLLNFEKRDISEALPYNGQLCNPSNKNSIVDRFYELYPKFGFEKTAKILWGKTVKRNYYTFTIKKIIKKLLNKDV